VSDVTLCQWLPKDDDEAIEQYMRDGWEIEIIDSYAGNFSVLATKREDDTMQQALKETEGKTRYSLLVEEFIEEMVRVRENGAAKYDDWDWVRGREWTDYLDAMRRHMKAFNADDLDGIDKESGLHHMAHVAVNAMFLYVLQAHKQGNDNRHGKLAERILEEERVIAGTPSVSVEHFLKGMYAK
jgi:hypothetical protein